MDDVAFRLVPVMGKVVRDEIDGIAFGQVPTQFTQATEKLAPGLRSAQPSPGIGEFEEYTCQFHSLTAARRDIDAATLDLLDDGPHDVIERIPPEIVLPRRRVGGVHTCATAFPSRRFEPGSFVGLWLRAFPGRARPLLDSLHSRLLDV